MSLQTASHAARVLARRPGLLRPGVVAALVGLTALRLPFLGSWLGKDEAGYLLVGGQWHAGGTSLYGDQWVDRPPLLISLYGLADRLGGAVPLRLLGLVAALVTVLAVAHAARTVVGDRAPTWAALVTAALLATPATGAGEVNGELLGAPFVAVSVAALLAALSPTARRPGRAALLCGAAAVAAVLVKQNLLDAFLLGTVLLALAVAPVGRSRVRRALLGAAAGAVGALVVAAVWTLAHGTSLGAVWEAMYPFRLAAREILTARPSGLAPGRAATMLASVVLTGIGLLGGLLVVLALTGPGSRGRPGAPLAQPLAVAATVTVAWDVLSIWMGGGWWLHYLVQLVVPLGLGAGLVAARWPQVGRVTALGVAGSALVSCALLGRTAFPPGGNPVGEAIGASARPQDTIVTIWGNADVTRASGLTSPYPYLWLLPAKVRDPRSTLLQSTLEGPHAPTWFVTFGTVPRPVHGPGSRLRRVVEAHYRQVATLDGSAVYLHDGSDRPTPTLSSAGR